jgi:hypothetical protein
MNTKGSLAQIARRAFRVHDSAARAHPVDGTGLNALDGSEAIAVHYRPVEQVGHRGQTNVRMRPDIDIHAGLELHWTEMIKKHEGPHGTTCQGGQQSRDAKTAAEILFVPANLQEHGYFVRSGFLAR